MDLSDIRWLFFDLGNTLVSEEEAIRDRIEGLVEAFGERGMQIPAADIEKALEQASAEFASRAIARAIENLVDSPEAHAYILERVRYRKELEKPYPDAHGVLSDLSSRYRVGVIANQSAGTEERLQENGLGAFISLCLSSAEIGLKKPDPAIFELALKQAGCKPHQAVMIGDRVDNDIRPAKSLGWKTIRVLQGIARRQTPREPMEEADFTVKGLSDILDLSG